MIELELDGKKVNAEAGSTILEVALDQGKYIPHFCYHKKLSIAANCRMCLVEVEKAPKPLPACATPVTEGMKVHTCSKLAVEAQKGVMEFLLINHPLDCPICDQGGECQLQDLAVGYGKSSSRFTEEKRAVTNKDLGPLVSTEMTRCIHCSRCVRFTDEIAGYQELGMSYRNNHVEVMPFIGQTVDSEISGNIIDICPVGALTSKPFRNQARNWELSRRKSIAPHDGLGSNIMVQVDKYHHVVRVLPLENEAINECWISDRDRFSYTALTHEERALTPMIKQDGKWLNVDWENAIRYAAKSIALVKEDHGHDTVGVLASSISTTEELYLLQKLMRGLGINNIDSRLSQSDFSLDDKLTGAQYLNGTIVDLITSKSIFVIGSVLREEQPLLTQRIRQAVKKGTKLHMLNVMAEDLLCKVDNQITADPRELAYMLAQIVKATQTADSDAGLNLHEVIVSPEARKVAEELKHNPGYIVLGDVAKSMPDYANVVVLAHQLAKNINAKVGFLSAKANEVGAQMVGAVPYKSAFNHNVASLGMNTQQMLENSLRAYVLFNTELELDAYDSAATLKSLKKADTVIVFTAYVNEAMKEYADVILPIAPFTETAGSFINLEGRWQKFNGATKPLGDSKPGWKVLRVLANQLGVDGFDYTSIDEVRSELEQLANPAALLNNALLHSTLKMTKPDLNGFVRFGIQGIYNSDSITRRALPLQETPWALKPTLSIAPSLAAKLDLVADMEVHIAQDGGTEGKFTVAICDKLPANVVLLAANKNTSGFAGRFAAIKINA